jgi:hypothetical protein
MRNEVLIDYVFHYSPYREQWAAVPRDHYLDYFNGVYDNVVFHESVNSLISFISKNK